MPCKFFQYLFIFKGIAMIIDSHTHLFAEAVEQNRSPYFENEPEFKLL